MRSYIYTLFGIQLNTEKHALGSDIWRQSNILISMKSIMNPYQKSSSVKPPAFQKSQPKPTFQQKCEFYKSLLKVLQSDKSCNMFDTLFGFTLAKSNIPIAEASAIELRICFRNMQQCYKDKFITMENVVLIIVDALQYKKADQSKSERQKIKRFLGTITYNYEEVMGNQRFILDKWERQQRIEQQNQKNQQAFYKFLEEEKQVEKKKVEQAEAKGWQCPVCCCEIDRNFFGILQCGHIFHPQCINAYIKTKIESNEIDIKCCMQSCKHVLDGSQVLNFIDGQLTQKYEKMSFNQFVQRNNASTSWCPTAGCQAVFQFDAALDNYRCPACKKHYCLRCRCDFHVGMTCKQYRINNSFDKNDQDFLKFVQGAKFKQCPKCKYWVQRNTGCPTMTCKCGQQFCYDCGGTGCPHGSCSNSGKVLAPIVIPPISGPPARNNR